MDAQLKKGILEICVLTALRKEESYGYKIVSDLAPFVAISESTLYPILRRLEERGAVTVRNAEHNGRLRKYFRITQAGVEKIEDFIDGMQEFQKISEYILENNE